MFLEVCLDAQGAPVAPGRRSRPRPAVPAPRVPAAPRASDDDDRRGARPARRRRSGPCCCSAAACSREAAAAAAPLLRAAGIPPMTTWNGIDRVGSDEPFYFGRPNTWGQRSANVIQQQADLLVALGTPLGLQQTGLQLAGVRAARPGRAGRHRPRRAGQGPPAGRPAPSQADAERLLPRLLDRPADLRTSRTGSSFCRRGARAAAAQRAGQRHAPGLPGPVRLVPRPVGAVHGATTSSSRARAAAPFTFCMQAFQQKLGQVDHHRQRPGQHGLRAQRGDRRGARAARAPHRARRGRRRLRAEPAGAGHRRASTT